MRKLLLSLVIIIPLVIFGILILKNQNTNPNKSSAENLSPSPVAQSNSTQVNNLTISWFEINNIDSLKLIPNFSEKLSSKEVIQQNNCSFLSSSAFYDKNNQPLGLFIAEGDKLFAYHSNSLLDGILSINDLATPRITRTVPEDNLQIAVQSGPIIKENNNFIDLKIMNDKESRRVLAAVTGENKLFFLTIYDSNSEYSGPLLADVPNVIKDFEGKSGLTFADAINLDGGSASVFYTKSDQLFEFNPVGAFFCQP